MVKWLKEQWYNIESAAVRQIIIILTLFVIGEVVFFTKALALPIKTDRKVTTLVTDFKKMDSLKLDKKSFEDYKVLHDEKDANFKEDMKERINLVITLLHGDPSSIERKENK